MSTYAYLSSSFDQTGMTVYHPANAASGFSIFSHYSVNLLGGNVIATIVIFINFIVMLGGYVLLAFTYIFQAAIDTILRGFDALAHALMATLGSYRSIASFIAVAISMFVQIFVSLIFYAMLVDIMFVVISLTDTICGQLADVVLSGGVGGDSAAGEIYFVMSVGLSAVVTFFFVQGAITWRKAILGGMNETIDMIVAAALGEKNLKAASTGLGGIGGAANTEAKKKALGVGAVLAGAGAGLAGAVMAEDAVRTAANNNAGGGDGTNSGYVDEDAAANDEGKNLLSEDSTGIGGADGGESSVHTSNAGGTHGGGGSSRLEDDATSAGTVDGGDVSEGSADSNISGSDSNNIDGSNAGGDTDVNVAGDSVDISGDAGNGESALTEPEIGSQANSDGSVTDTATDDNGNLISRTYDPNTGNMISEHAEMDDGSQVDSTYDENGNLAKSVATDADGTQTTTDYNADGSVAGVESVDSVGNKTKMTNNDDGTSTINKEGVDGSFAEEQWSEANGEGKLVSASSETAQGVSQEYSASNPEHDGQATLTTTDAKTGIESVEVFDSNNGGSTVTSNIPDDGSGNGPIKQTVKKDASGNAVETTTEGMSTVTMPDGTQENVPVTTVTTHGEAGDVSTSNWTAGDGTTGEIEVRSDKNGNVTGYTETVSDGGMKTVNSAVVDSNGDITLDSITTDSSSVVTGQSKTVIDSNHNGVAGNTLTTTSSGGHEVSVLRNANNEVIGETEALGSAKSITTQNGANVMTHDQNGSNISKSISGPSGTTMTEFKNGQKVYEAALNSSGYGSISETGADVSGNPISINSEITSQGTKTSWSGAGGSGSYSDAYSGAHRVIDFTGADGAASGQVQIDPLGKVTASGNLVGASIANTSSGQTVSFDSGRQLHVEPQSNGTVKYTDISATNVVDQYTMSRSGEILEHTHTGVAGASQSRNNTTGTTTSMRATGTTETIAINEDIKTTNVIYGGNNQYGSRSGQTNMVTGSWNAVSQTSAGNTMVYNSTQPQSSNNFTFSSGAGYAGSHGGGAINSANMTYFEKFSVPAYNNLIPNPVSTPASYSQATQVVLNNRSYEKQGYNPERYGGSSVVNLAGALGNQSGNSAKA